MRHAGVFVRFGDDKPDWKITRKFLDNVILEPGFSFPHWDAGDASFAPSDNQLRPPTDQQD